MDPNSGTRKFSVRAQKCDHENFRMGLCWDNRGENSRKVLSSERSTRDFDLISPFYSIGFFQVFIPGENKRKDSQ